MEVIRYLLGGKGRALAGGGRSVTIVLSADTISEGASIGAAVGTLSVRNGAGSYSFSIASDPDGKFAIDGSALELADTLSHATAAQHQVTIEADNGVDPPVSKQFTIFVAEEGALGRMLRVSMQGFLDQMNAPLSLTIATQGFLA